MMPPTSPCLDVPSPEILRRLALSESGFVFDPVSGDSFTVNETGLALLRLLQRETDTSALTEAITTAFDVTSTTVERDLIEFFGSLRQLLQS